MDGVADIVLAEDDADIGLTTRLLLEMEGHTVRLATNGKEALCRIEEKCPDLVIADIEMPQMTGPEMAKTMYLENCGREFVPVVVFSAYPDIRAIAAQIGTPYYISKPFNVDALLSLVHLALTERIPPKPSRG